MYYIGKLKKKSRFFQKAYEIDGNIIYITNTKRGKVKFLKSGIRNVVFTEEFKNDHIIGKEIEQMTGYDRNFVVGFTENMMRCITEFFHLSLPVEEIAIYSSQPEDIIPTVLGRAKLITIVDRDGESRAVEGINIRYVKRLKGIPDIIIKDKKISVLNVFRVPIVSLIGDERTSQTLSYDTMAFKTELLPFEINAPVVMYLINKHGNIPFEITSCRKKLPPLFTFG